jgi:hypothetical protein
MLLQPLRRAALPSSASSELVEPSTGTATAFIQKLREFPGATEDSVTPHYFSGLRVLICLFDDGKPFLPKLINDLNQTDASAWPITVLESDSIRQVIDALEASYLARVVDYFIDAISVGQMEEINTLLREKVWTQADSGKN